jgi:tripartite ATP-independent transporter DctM subunit
VLDNSVQTGQPTPSTACGRQANEDKSVLARAANVVAIVVTSLALVAEVVVLFGEVVLRDLFHAEIAWNLEVAEIAIVSQGFVGAVLAYRSMSHVAVEALIGRLPEPWQGYCRAFNDWLVLGLSIWLICLTWQVLPQQWHQTTPILQFPDALFFVCVIVGFALIAATAVVRLVLSHGKAAGLPGAVFLALALVVLLVRDNAALASNGLGIAILLGSTAFLIILGAPIAFCMIAGWLLFDLYGPAGLPLSTISLSLEQGINNVDLLAIPLFIATGFLMAEGGLSAAIVAALEAYLGRVRGSLHHVMIVAMLAFSGLSGSKLADVAAVGPPLRTGLKELEFPPEDSAALLAASAAGGETVPPSIAMIILGSITSLSISRLFVGGILPAILITALLMVVVAVRNRGRRSTARASVRKKTLLTLKSLPALSAIVILIGGIASGLATPTEIGSFAVLYAFLLGLVVYRGLTRAGLGRAVLQASQSAGMVLFIVAAASAFANALVVSNIPTDLSNWLGTFGHDKLAFFAISVVALIVLGSIFEGLPAILIFGPLLLPIAASLGVNTIQYAIVFLLSMGIGVFAPPIGVGLFASSAMFDVKLDRTARPSLVYLSVVLLGIVVVAIFPWFTNAL